MKQLFSTDPPPFGPKMCINKLTDQNQVVMRKWGASRRGLPSLNAALLAPPGPCHVTTISRRIFQRRIQYILCIESQFNHKEQPWPINLLLAQEHHEEGDLTKPTLPYPTLVPETFPSILLGTNSTCLRMSSCLTAVRLGTKLPRMCSLTQWWEAKGYSFTLVSTGPSAIWFRPLPRNMIRPSLESCHPENGYSGPQQSSSKTTVHQLKLRAIRPLKFWLTAEGKFCQHRREAQVQVSPIIC